MKSKGFTLIELLIVIVLISIFSGFILGVINPSGLRAKTRDSQRVADLKKVQSALELYYADNRKYPVGSNGVRISLALSSLVSGGYIPSLPTDPAPSASAGYCSGYRNYYYGSSGTSYALAAVMEVGSSADISSCPSWCGSTPALAYCVKSPNL